MYKPTHIIASIATFFALSAQTLIAGTPLPETSNEWEAVVASCNSCTTSTSSTSVKGNKTKQSKADKKKAQEEKKRAKQEKAAKKKAEKAQKKAAKKQKVQPIVDPRSIMTEVYDRKSGFGIPAHETKLIEGKGGAPTYGEIKADSLAVLLHDLNITKKDVIYDLGSGIGKVIVQSYLEFPFKKAVGIELSEKRYNLSTQVLDALKNRGLVDPKRHIEFIYGDFVETPFKDATVVYLCSTCYSDELMTTLAEKFSQLKKGAHIISLKQIKDPAKHKLALTKEYRLPMTWSGPDGSPVYVYERTNKKIKQS